MSNKILKKCRKGIGLTQKDVSEKVGITETSYKRIECGTRRPSLSTAFKIADVLETTVEKLFKGI